MKRDLTNNRAVIIKIITPNYQYKPLTTLFTPKGHK
jgi:hypothetical protein